MKDDILFWKWWTAGTDRVVHQLVLPKTLRTVILGQLHDIPSSGHLGIKRTLARVSKHFYWVGCKDEVIYWCHGCLKSQRLTNPRREYRGPMKQYNTMWEHL